MISREEQKMLDITKINEVAQELVNELSAEMKQKNEEVKLLQGAIKGIEVLYNKLLETNNAVETDEVGTENITALDKKKRTRAKKQKAKTKV